MNEATVFTESPPDDHTDAGCAMCGQPITANQACVRVTDRVGTGPINLLLHHACHADLAVPAAKVRTYPADRVVV